MLRPPAVLLRFDSFNKIININKNNDNNNNNIIIIITIKYGPLRWELKRQFPGYDIRQYNIIIDVLGGWSTEVDEAMRELFGSRGGELDSTPDAESRHLAHPKHCPHTESDVLRIEQSELRHF